MIIDDEVLLKISSTNFKYYKSKGYKFKKGDTITVDVKDLQFGTGVKVNVECDICGSKNKIYLQKYNINFKRQGYYSCLKCSDIKRKNTNNKKYGVDNISQSKQIKKKKKITTLKNYGVENPSQSDEIKNKKCETMLKNYGVEYVLQSKELINNIKKSKFQIYGNENYNNRIQSKETCLSIYGVENPSQSDEIKNKKCETSMKNYGVNNVLQSNEVINKIKCTMLKRYGVTNPMQNRELFLKAKRTLNKIHQYKDTSIYYQGTYELDFLNNYIDKIKIEQIDKIPYNFKNKIRYYHPDFYNKKLNLIIEIKSDYTFNLELEKNLSKQKGCLDKGYNFIFIINKDYENFDLLI